MIGLKSALAKGIPVIFGFSVPDYFESDLVAQTGWVPYPQSNTPIIGGHAVLAVGYDTGAQGPFVWVANSWGSGWGIAGYCKMATQWFNSIGNNGLVSDAWTLIGA